MTARELVERVSVVDEARSWTRTPYHHAADVKGHGVDCAMILVRVYCDLGLVEKFDPRPYTRDWMMHRNEERYLGFLFARAKMVTGPKPGDIILFRVGRCFAHGGIVTVAAPLTIVHAYSPAGAVLEEDIGRNCDLAARLPKAKFASYWG
jgi:cell wall-associated NlpC family hydrolase